MLTGLTKLERLNVGWCNCIKNQDMNVLSGKTANWILRCFLFLHISIISVNLSILFIFSLRLQIKNLFSELRAVREL